MELSSSIDFSFKHRIVLPLSPVLRFGRFEPFSGHFPSGNSDAGDILMLMMITILIFVKIVMFIAKGKEYDACAHLSHPAVLHHRQ